MGQYGLLSGSVTWRRRGLITEPPLLIKPCLARLRDMDVCLAWVTRRRRGLITEPFLVIKPCLAGLRDMDLSGSVAWRRYGLKPPLVIKPCLARLQDMDLCLAGSLGAAAA